MKSFLKSSRQAGSKKYLGLVGSLLTELIDEEPVIQNLIEGTRFNFTPSQVSRYSGREKRMILTTFSNDAVLILTTQKESFLDGGLVELSVFVNQSQIPSHALLNDAEKLAFFRWPAATLLFQCTSAEEYVSFALAGWKTSDTTSVKTVFKKFIGPGKR